MALTQQFLDETVSSESVQSLVELRPWMQFKKLVLVDTLEKLDAFIDEACEAGICAVDTETSSLNTGPKGRRASKEGTAELAGICLAYQIDYGIYIPVGHFEGRNLPVNAVVARMKRLVSSCLTIYHNAKYDLEILRNYGIIIEDPSMYRDTILGAAVLWADRKSKGLKSLTKDFLGKEMIELKDIVPGRKHIDFRTIHPKVAVFYAASDAVCTLELYHYQQALLQKMDPGKNNGTFFIYNLEHACLMPVLEMERNLVKVNPAHYAGLVTKIETRTKTLEDEIYASAGQVFNYTSNKQLGDMLFRKLKIPYPVKETAKNGDFLVNDEIFEAIAKKHPLPRLIQEYREMDKIKGTYLDNLLKNIDDNSCVKFQLNQTAADSGRFSGSGGKGLEVDGYSGVNCQNLPRVKKGDPWQLRKGIVAREGFSIVAIDYSGEELRIATNFSKEETWITEFNEGTGDLHSITAALLFGSTPEEMALPKNKELRGIGKTINFLILYGGGAGKLAASAGISISDAQERLANFFNALPKLNDWLKTERIRARRRGYSLTAFGRRRPLMDLYNSGDRGLMAKADRLACNAAIQGTGADIIKLAMVRTWQYIRNNNLSEDLRMLLPVHDELVFEMRTSMLDTLIPAVANVMKIRDLTNKIGWKVPLEVDAEYGDSFMVPNNYFEDIHKYNMPTSVRLGLSPEQYKEITDMINEKGIEKADEIYQQVLPLLIEKSEKSSPQNEEEKLSYDPMSNQNSSLKKIEKETSAAGESSEKVDLVNSSSEFFTFEVSKTDTLAKAHADAIWAVLDGIDSMCTGPRKRIRLSRDKKIIHTTNKKYSIDGFLALAFNYTI